MCGRIRPETESVASCRSLKNVEYDPGFHLGCPVLRVHLEDAEEVPP
jgi:hypothetical protein